MTLIGGSLRGRTVLIVSAVGLGAFSGAAVLSGSGSAQPPAEPSFAVLEKGRAFDLASVRLRPEKFSFPGIQLDTLRLARTLPKGTKVIVGRASNDFVCLFVVPPRTNFRDAHCAPGVDIGRTALIGNAWWGKQGRLLMLPTAPVLPSLAAGRSRSSTTWPASVLMFGPSLRPAPTVGDGYCV